MTSFYSDKLVCGNCTETLPLLKPKKNLRWCTFHECIVSISEMCCLAFEWTGETDLDNQLIRFPREEVDIPVPMNH